MNSIVHRFARSAISGFAAIPGIERLIEMCALAPVTMKTPPFHRIIGTFARYSGHGDKLIATNFGLNGGFRMMAPSSKSNLLYSRPDSHIEERVTLAICRLLARHSKAFVDVGANEGIFTFAIAAEIGRENSNRIHTFEPDDLLYERLSGNLLRNQLNVHLHKMAVGDRVGRQTFHRNLASDLSGSLTEFFQSTHPTEPVEVEITTLAHYLAEHDLQNVCLKIDVEGAGDLVWQGVRSQSDRVDWMIMEMITPEIEACVPHKIISDTGWSAYYIRDFELVPSLAGEFIYKAPFYNWLFTPHNPARLLAALKGTPFRILDDSR